MKTLTNTLTAVLALAGTFTLCAAIGAGVALAFGEDVRMGFAIGGAFPLVAFFTIR